MSLFRRPKPGDHRFAPFLRLRSVMPLVEHDDEAATDEAILKQIEEKKGRRDA